jgi:hypothetical protein
VVERLRPGAPWMFLGPIMMVIFIAICFAGMFFILRAMQRHSNETAVMSSTGVCGIGVWPSGRNTSGGMEASDIGHSAFEEYRAQTLQRLDQEQREFQEFIARLRAAKDKEEFEQFITDRRMRPPSSQA